MFHLAHQPFRAGEVLPQWAGTKFRPVGPVHEVCPRTRNQRPFAAASLGGFHLRGRLVRSHQVIRVQPLNVISLAHGEGVVPSCRCTLILLRHNFDLIRLKLPRDRQCLILRAIVYDDDLFVAPTFARSPNEACPRSTPRRCMQE